MSLRQKVEQKIILERKPLNTKFLNNIKKSSTSSTSSTSKGSSGIDPALTQHLSDTKPKISPDSLIVEVDNGKAARVNLYLSSQRQLRYFKNHWTGFFLMTACR